MSKIDSVTFSNSRRPRRRFQKSSGGRPARPNGTSPAAARPAPIQRPATPEQLEAIAASAFTKVGLAPALVRSVIEEGYETPTPVQAQVIPHALDRRDVLACAQTGTGKTAAFILPILHHLSAAGAKNGEIRALVLTPTRELAGQIAESARVYGRHVEVRHAVIYGGVSQLRQEKALRASPDLLVATPGRLLDLMQQGLVRFDGVTHFVLDEADRMLDMGFVHDVKRIAKALPGHPQTLLFSATMAPAIDSLARGMLENPARVSVSPKVTTAETVEQSVVFVAKADKQAALRDVLGDEDVERALVFTRTKHGANRLSKQLDRAGISCEAIHGNKSQGARERALASFRSGATRVLVATDVAARGIDVEGISHVINFDLPNVAESYVHRIGRTGRAGAVGRAISFCAADERSLLVDIERLIRTRLPVTGDPPAPEPAPAPAAVPNRAPKKRWRRRGARPS